MRFLHLSLLLLLLSVPALAEKPKAKGLVKAAPALKAVTPAFTPPSTAAAKYLWVADSPHTTIYFVGKHLMNSNVYGSFAEFDSTVHATENGYLIAATVDINTASLQTGNASRDKHLKSGDFLDVEKFAKVKFKTSKVRFAGNVVIVTGDLTIRDVTRQVTLTGEFFGVKKADLGVGERDYLGYTFSTTINRRDFGMKFERMYGADLMVSNEIKLEIQLKAYRKEKLK